jgi:HrpA-like RNA helicase
MILLQELRTTSDFCLYISISAGRLLAELPVEPRLGKMILFSVVLKCLDPAVVLACAMAYKDPCMHCFISFLSICSFFKRFKIENDQVYHQDSMYLFL